MNFFVKKFVLPLLVKRKWTHVCEIGASFGDSTELLATVPGVSITVIDPCLDCDLAKEFAGNSRITIEKGISLDILPKLTSPFDCILIDGDHNWYTVYHELKLISYRSLLKQGGIVFFHDVGKPWGRRDMYYQPELIPAEHRHSWAFDEVFPEIRAASHEGGTHNGVLTAIEDFMREHKGGYKFFRIREEFGLGVMYRRNDCADDFKFFMLKCKGNAYNGFIGLKEFGRAHLPSAFSLGRLLFRSAKMSAHELNRALKQFEGADRILRRLDRPVSQLFHLLFYRDAASTWASTQWMGVPLLKLPLDLWVYQEILYKTQPDLIIETGTNRGGSALYFANLFDLIGKGRIISVDITHPAEGLPNHPRIRFLLGSSTDPKTLTQVTGELRSGERVMVVLDSDHSRHHVLQELELYSPFVSVGCYLVVEDTNVNGHPVWRSFGPGPMEALEDFLRTHSEFVCDQSCEKYKVTFSPRGWVKRLSEGSLRHGSPPSA